MRWGRGRGFDEFDLRRRVFRSPERKALGFGLVGVVGILLLVTFQIERINLDAVIGLLTLGVLLLVSIPLLSGLARSDKDPTLFTLLMWGVVFKVAFTLVRYYVITVVYGDNGDAGVYNGMGSILMDLYRQGIFVVEVPGVPNRGAETQRIAVVVGLIYMITGPSRYASSFIFSAMCFSGQVLMFRAFRLAVPEGDSETLRGVGSVPPVDALLAVLGRKGGVDGVLHRHSLVRRCADAGHARSPDRHAHVRRGRGRVVLHPAPHGPDRHRRARRRRRARREGNDGDGRPWGNRNPSTGPTDGLNSAPWNDSPTAHESRRGREASTAWGPSASDGEAVVDLQGAHVAHFQPKGEKPVLWMSAESRFEARQADPGRGAGLLPLVRAESRCAPDAPLHGFARILAWSIAAVDRES